MDVRRKVNPPTVITMYPAMFPCRRGESFRRMNTPALTIVDECSSADVGVGATMAPSSHVWKGICADLTIPARQSRATDRRMNFAAGSDARSRSSSRNP